MKYCIALLIAITFLTCKSKPYIKSKTEIAKDSVAVFLNNILEYPKTYKSVKWDSINIEYTPKPDTADITLSAKGSDAILEVSDSMYHNNLFNQRNKSGYYIRFTDSERRSMLISMNMYKPKFIGYYIDHEYRAKNNIGKVTLYQVRFTLDTSFKVVQTEVKP